MISLTVDGSGMKHIADVKQTARKKPCSDCQPLGIGRLKQYCIFPSV